MSKLSVSVLTASEHSARFSPEDGMSCGSGATDKYRIILQGDHRGQEKLIDAFPHRQTAVIILAAGERLQHIDAIQYNCYSILN